MKKANRDPTLCRMFVREAKRALSAWPNVVHSWSIDEDEDHCILDIPRQPGLAQAIWLEVNPEEVVLLTEDCHFHYLLDFYRDNSHQSLVEYTLGLLRDLLSSSMRIRELRYGTKAYKWHLERYENGAWIIEDTTGLFPVLRLFRRRSEHIYQNDLLPPRVL